MSVTWHDSRHALPDTRREAGLLLKSRYSEQFSMFTGRRLPLTLAFVVLIGLAFGASCKGFFVDPQLTSITVGPTSQNIRESETLQMGARGSYDDGSSKNITGSVKWLSDAPSDVATISPSGVVTGGKTPGTTNITATKDAITSNSVAVNVVITPTSINITPNPLAVKAGGGTITCQAFAQPQGTDISAQVVWTITNSANYTLTQGETPETITTLSGAKVNDTDTLTATYTVGSTQFTATATVNVQ